jgi:hypothetical protein
MANDMNPTSPHPIPMRWLLASLLLLSATLIPTTLPAQIARGGIMTPYPSLYRSQPRPAYPLPSDSLTDSLSHGSHRISPSAQREILNQGQVPCPVTAPNQRPAAVILLRRKG